MSNPQKELGHVQIATGKPENDVLSAIGSAQFSGVEYQVLVYILRKTWGFNKKRAWIAMSQFVDFTGRSEEGVHKAIRALRGKNVIHTEGVSGKPSIYEFNKDFTSWNGVYYSTGVNKSTGVYTSTKRGGVQKDAKGVYASGPTKETITKETITKEKPTVTVPIFSPSNFMPDFVVEPSPDGDQPPAPKKKSQPFNWEDYSELVRLMKKHCGFTTLENGKTPQDNYARHILLKLLKILVKEHAWPEQEAIDHVRANMEDFCVLVQKARDADNFLFKTLTTLKNIYFKLPEIFEITKKKAPKSSHLAL